MDNTDRLIKHAIDASKNSYSPYSKFRVGAAVLLNDNNIVPGCNIENVSYAITNCAERTALFSCYAQGYKKKDIVSIAVVGDTNSFVTPCGACIQAMAELISESCIVILSNLDNSIVHTCTIVDLLPMTFDM